MKLRRIVPTCITLTILLCGFHAMLQSVAGHYIQAAQLIILGAILDGIDGEVARLFRGVTTFGAKLDTYVDTVSFGVAPAFLVHLAVWQDFGFWGMVFTSCILFSAVIRFSMYQVKQSRVKHETFRGLPIPVSAVWMAMTIIIAESDLLVAIGVNSAAPILLFMWACTLVFLALQLSRVRYSKPTKEMIAFALVAGVLLMVATQRPVTVICLGTCVAMGGFAFLNPFYVHRFMEDEEEQEEQAYSG